MLMAAGVALTLINTKACSRRCSGFRPAFARTAKYAIGKARKFKVQQTAYRRRSGWLPYVELAIGAYFVYMVVFRHRDDELLRRSRSCCFVRRLLVGRLQHPLPGNTANKLHGSVRKKLLKPTKLSSTRISSSLFGAWGSKTSGRRSP